MPNAGTLYFLIGKMGAGKSTYAQQLSEGKKAVLISEDDWLSYLYPNEIQTFDDFVVRHRKLLNALTPHIKQLLRLGTSVVLDFPANTRQARAGFIKLANDAQARHEAVFLNTSDERCLTQIAQRAKEQPERAKTDTPDMFAATLSYFEAPDDAESLNLTTITPA